MTWRVMLRAAAMSLLAMAASLAPASASTGGPELAEALGWDPTSGTVYFRLLNVDESGDAPSIVRLTLGREGSAFEPLAWSLGANEDSTYRSNVRRLRKSLRPLQEVLTTSIPERQEIAVLDTLRDDYGDWPRFRVRVAWFNGACEGWVEATTYRDPSLRMVRLFRVPGRADMIGVFSFVGVRTEYGYERQVPVLLPNRGQWVRIEEEWRQ